MVDRYRAMSRVVDGDVETWLDKWIRLFPTVIPAVVEHNLSELTVSQERNQ